MLPADSPFFGMVGVNHQILQHRLVMAQHLGRCLNSDEFVHHLNGIRDDNRIENLALVDAHSHPKHTLARLLKKRVRELEVELNKMVDV